MSAQQMSHTIIYGCMWDETTAWHRGGSEFYYALGLYARFLMHFPWQCCIDPRDV